ncbi:MAG TPA: tetratricopeptide repeat protein, partial [Anaerolineales bacterium]
DAYLLPGLYDFVLGSLPGPIKVLLFFGGFTGNKNRGIQRVESVSAWGNGSKYDAQILLTVMYRREKRYADGRRMLRELSSAFPRNYIFPLEVASLYKAAGEDPQSVGAYEQVLADVRQAIPGYSDAPVARIHFELGELYRKMGDLPSARRHLEQVAGAHGSNPEMEKQSVMRLQEVVEAIRQQEAATQSVPRS